MWQNIAGLGVLLTLISIIFGYFMVRLNGVENMLDKNQETYNLKLDQKVNKEIFNSKNEELARDLKRGEKSFDAINIQLKKQGELLVQIDTTVKLILKKGKMDN